MKTQPCGNCGAEVPIYDKAPAWCPRCGADFAVLPESNRAQASRWTLPPTPRAASTGPSDQIARMEENPSESLRLPAHATNTASTTPPNPEPLPAPEPYDPAIEDPYGLNRLCPCCGCVFTGPEAMLAVCPCPTCGVMRPGSVADDRAMIHTFIGGIVVVVVALFGFLGYAGVLTIDTAGITLLCLVGAASLAHVWLLLNPPGGNLEENRKAIAISVRKEVIDVIRRGDLTNFRDPSRLNTGHVLCVIALMLAPVGFLAPMVARQYNGWAMNRNHAPYVISPGDTLTANISMPAISSVSGLWDGKARCRLDNTEEVGKEVSLRIRTREEQWGKSLHVSGRSTTRSVAVFPTEITLPADADLERKTLRLRVDLEVSYPSLVRNVGQADGFRNLKASQTQFVSVTLSPIAASTHYRNIFGWSLVIGSAFYLLGALGLVSLVRHVLKQRPGDIGRTLSEQPR